MTTEATTSGSVMSRAQNTGASRRGDARPVEPGIFLRDGDWSGVDTDDLGRVLRELPVIINLIDDLKQYTPFVRNSINHPGCTENTKLGETFSDLHKWLQYQLEEAFQTLRETPPTRADLAECRSLDIIEYMARHVGFLVDIATDALRLEAEPMAALPRTEQTWVARYLKERQAND